MSRRASRSSPLLALSNPYVVLADVVIAALFFVILHAVRNLAAINVRSAQVRSSLNTVATHLLRQPDLKVGLEDESLAFQARNYTKTYHLQGGESELVWWATLPQNARLILKRDVSFIKLIFVEPPLPLSTPAARWAGQTPNSLQVLLRQLARFLATDPELLELVRNRQIVEIAVEGHTRKTGASGQDPNGAVAQSLESASQVRTLLLQELQPYYQRDRKVGIYLGPATFSVVGRGSYQPLPFSTGSSRIRNLEGGLYKRVPATLQRQVKRGLVRLSRMNERIQIVLRFSERYQEREE